MSRGPIYRKKFTLAAFLNSYFDLQGKNDFKTQNEIIDFGGANVNWDLFKGVMLKDDPSIKAFKNAILSWVSYGSNKEKDQFHFFLTRGNELNTFLKQKLMMLEIIPTYL